MSYRVEFCCARKLRTLDTEVTALDEATGNSKNLVGKERNIERLRDERIALEQVEEGLVARFDGHDGSGRSEDARVLDEVCGTEVRPDTNVLNELGDRHHGRDVHEHARKVEGASRQRRLAKADNEFLDGGHMDGLVDLDDRDLGDGDVGRRETGAEKVGRLEFGQALRVELGLEVLEDEGKFCFIFLVKEKSRIHQSPPPRVRTEKSWRLTEDLQAGSVNGTWKWRSPHGEWGKESSS